MKTNLPRIQIAWYQHEQRIYSRAKKGTKKKAGALPQYERTKVESNDFHKRLSLESQYLVPSFFGNAIPSHFFYVDSELPTQLCIFGVK